MEIGSNLHLMDDNCPVGVVEAISDASASSSKRIVASQEPHTNRVNRTSKEQIPNNLIHSDHVMNEATATKKLDPVLTWIQSIPDQKLPFPSSPIEAASLDSMARKHIQAEDFSGQTAILLRSVSHRCIPAHKDSQADTQSQLEFESRHNAAKPSEQFLHGQSPYQQTDTNYDSEERSVAHLQALYKSNPTKEIQESIAAQERISDALRPHYAEKEPNNTFIPKPRRDEDEILEVADYFNVHNKKMESLSTYTSQLDSSPAGFTTDFEDLHSFDSLSSNSSDLDLVERDESCFAVQHQLRRTYSSSEDSYRGMDIETLSSESTDQTSFTTCSSTVESVDSSSIDSSYTSYEEAENGGENCVQTLSEIDDDVHETSSASSADAELAWRDEILEPIPHHVRRTYSSSESEQSCDKAQAGLANNYGEEDLIAYMQSTWRSDARISETYSSLSGSCPHRSFILRSDATRTEERVESELVGAVETMDSLQNLRSHRSAHANNLGSQAATSKKAHILKKAARLFHHIFGSKTSSAERQRSENRTKKRSLSSLFWGKSAS